MRTLAIGDIHGCFAALAALEKFASIRPTDMVVTLGDYVNRGPDSRAVIDWLVARQQLGTLTALRGNHEVLMLDARDGGDRLRNFLAVGGAATLASYSPRGDAGKLTDVPHEHWEFLQATLPWHETATHFFVHANAYPDVPLAEQPDHMLFWESFDSPSPHESGKTMVCGHTSQKSGRPADVGHAVCIDTWAYGGGWLTCLDIATGQYWQANRHGATRTDWLG